MKKIVYNFLEIQKNLDCLSNMFNNFDINDSFFEKINYNCPEIQNNLNTAKQSLLDDILNYSDDYKELINKTNLFINEYIDLENLLSQKASDIKFSYNDTSSNVSSNSSKEESSLQSNIYVVKNGDNLYNIAKRNGVSLNDLIFANKDKINNPSLIMPGLNLVIPTSNNVFAKSTATNNTSSFTAKQVSSDVSYSNNTNLSSVSSNNVDKTDSSSVSSNNVYNSNNVQSVNTTSNTNSSTLSFENVPLSYSDRYNVSNNPLTSKKGVVYYNNHKETYYSQKVLPGNGLKIPGRHVANDGTIRDENGYICVACNQSYLAKGTVLMTSLGPAKVYDCGCAHGTVDIYVDW